MKHRLARTVALAVLVVALGSLTLAASASAGAAVVTRQTITTPFSDTGLTDDCLPGLTGTIVGTDVVSLQSVETTNGFHVAGTDLATGRIDWSDGSYTIIGSTDHFSFNAAGHGTTVFTEAHKDFGDVYSASGVFLFRETFHSTEHLTVTNGAVTRVEFDKNRFHVFGGDCVLTS
jgi:hypothetical protein